MTEHNLHVVFGTHYTCRTTPFSPDDRKNLLPRQQPFFIIPQLNPTEHHPFKTTQRKNKINTRRYTAVLNSRVHQTYHHAMMHACMHTLKNTTRARLVIFGLPPNLTGKENHTQNLLCPYI
ncbi:hypothetical protein CEXT_616011 [Caerostris extrusa]|uniref:Uncharacterized protein n=1 Tax=Caerostris extrusa TaxID=172846 RepID=A0AAV4SLA3_CAEEX|nr:hypothetical protein CEXT_616011 [Caerostris extrusa]